MLYLLLINTNLNSQIANYVKNGGFDSLIDILNPNAEYKAFGWSGVDSTKICGPLYNLQYGGGIPNTGVGYQWPKYGNGFIRLQLYCPTCPANFKRSNVKNRLKQTLQVGKTYCVKAYISVQDNCSKGIDAFGFYFGDNTVDTIKYNARLPLTFLNPQVQNPSGNIITDTMNWTPITGTFVANGTEKFMVLANFKSDAMTNTATANSSVAGDYSEWFVDAVSCIPIDLPAYAGSDTYALPGSTVYIGRPLDVGINEACMWYNLTNTVTPIDTAAGITVTVAAITQTYIVKQDICGIIKYDTVIVYAGSVGLNEFNMVKDNFQIYPNPANTNVTLEFTNIIPQKIKILITNVTGKLIREEDVEIKNFNKRINLNLDLANGLYLVTIINAKNEKITRKLVIAK